jgi:hypothetical protein
MIDEIKRISKIKKERNMSNKPVKARFYTKKQFKKDYKLGDQDQAFRVIPPLSEIFEGEEKFAGQNDWSVFHAVHFGYKTSDGKLKPFLSSEVYNHKNKMVEVPDAAKERIETLKAELEKAKKTGNEAAQEKLEALVGFKGSYNIDKNHYLNVIDAQGNIGVLKIRHKCKLVLEKLLKDLHPTVDPFSVDDGRYLVFSRNVAGRDTTFTVNVLKEKLNVPGVGDVERDVVHKIDESLKNRIRTEAANLKERFKRPTAEEVKRIVDGSDLFTGVSPYLDELFGASKTAESTSEESYEDESEPTAPETVAAAPVTVPVATVQPKAAATVSQPKVTAPRVTPVTAKKSIEDMSNDDFLKGLEEGTL